MNPKRWLREHSLKLLAIRDTPSAIAGGVAIGIFFGFTPLLGLKTVLTVLCAWLTRSNILAAVLASAGHDIILPLMPVIYRIEYDVGYWLLSSPHRLPPSLARLHLKGEWWNWTMFLSVGKPLLVGSVICAGPFSILTFFIARGIIDRHQRKKHAQETLAP